MKLLPYILLVALFCIAFGVQAETIGPIDTSPPEAIEFECESEPVVWPIKETR